MKTKSISLYLGLAALWLATTANAGLICSTSYEDNHTANNGCEVGSTNNDTMNPLQVNLDEMFGFDDWLFAEKGLDSDDENIDVGLALVGDSISGQWFIDDVWGDYSDVMFVYKGGNAADPAHYVGYLLVLGDTSGDYYTPFANTNNGNPMDISHVSVYVRGTGNPGGPGGPENLDPPLPEPGTIMLMAIGLLIGARRLRTSDPR